MKDGWSVLLDHLRAGGEIWLPLAGRSMRPILKDGDFALVRGLTAAPTLNIGDIAVVDIGGTLIAHFVVRVGNDRVWTRGVRAGAVSLASPLGTVLGTVIARRRPPVWQRFGRRAGRLVKQLSRLQPASQTPVVQGTRPSG